jgi:predicted deacylase
MPSRGAENGLRYFATDYFAARDSFSQLAARQAAWTQRCPIQAPSIAGKELTLDAAYYGAPSPARLVIISSGIHGAEGFAGSALQQQLINELRAMPPLPSGGGLLLIHAINPYGFAHLRRVNENNVDLNRNCLAQFPGPVNSAYGTFDPLLNPTSPPGQDLFKAKLIWAGIRHGMRAGKRAIASGQYAFAKGLFYGGIERQESITIFEQLLRRASAENTRQVLHIDLHTGLGHYGHYKLLTDLPEGAHELQQLQKWFGADKVITSQTKNTSVYPAFGDIGELTQAGFDHCRVYPVTLEFGTYSLWHTLAMLRAENRLHYYGTIDSAAGHKIKADFQETFCPADPGWRLAILERGGKVLRQAIHCGFKSHSS